VAAAADVAQCQSIVQALARVPPACGQSALGVSGSSWRDTAASDRFWRSLVDQFARFTDRYGEMMPRAGEICTNDWFDSAPRLLARYHSRAT